jgi:hypothetical protein
MIEVLPARQKHRAMFVSSVLNQTERSPCGCYVWIASGWATIQVEGCQLAHDPWCTWYGCMHESPLEGPISNGLIRAPERRGPGSTSGRSRTSGQEGTSREQPGTGAPRTARSGGGIGCAGSSQYNLSPVHGGIRSESQRRSRKRLDPGGLRQGCPCRRYDPLVFRGPSGSTTLRA